MLLKKKLLVIDTSVASVCASIKLAPVRPMMALSTPKCTRMPVAPTMQEAKEADRDNVAGHLGDQQADEIERHARCRACCFHSRAAGTYMPIRERGLNVGAEARISAKILKPCVDRLGHHRFERVVLEHEEAAHGIGNLDAEEAAHVVEWQAGWRRDAWPTDPAIRSPRSGRACPPRYRLRHA